MDIGSTLKIWMEILSWFVNNPIEHMIFDLQKFSVLNKKYNICFYLIEMESIWDFTKCFYYFMGNEENGLR